MRWILRSFVALVLVLSATTAPHSQPAAQAAGVQDNTARPTVIDGKSPATAAASCYEIKQLNRSAPSGTYWLYTPELKAPQQFYCDQTTQGGGWVLIGAGRNNWEEHYEGNGDFAILAQGKTDPYAEAVQYPAAVIDALLNDGRVDQLSDGIMLQRATSTNGASTQNVWMQFEERERWTWTFGAFHQLSWYQFDGTQRYRGGFLPSFGTNNAYNSVDFSTSSVHRWTRGFSFGSQVRVNNTQANSYLHSPAGHSPRPTTRMYVRPTLTQQSLNLQPIADAGTDSIENLAIASSFAARGVWGVTGTKWNTRREGDVPAQAFAQVGDVMYVGGNFSTVQRGANGTKVNQAALAAFNANTGEYIDTFRPVFNHQVKSLVALPDGHLLVGGQFTTVNGKPAPGIVKLDPATGDISADWTLHLENRVSGGVRLVRYLEVIGDHVYLGGSFTHLRSSVDSHAIYSRNHARFDWKTGRPDPTWNPEFNGGVVDGSVDATTGTVYAAGYFTQSRGYNTFRVAAWNIETTDNSRPRNWNFVPSAVVGAGVSYQQAIAASGDRVYVGGAEHSVFGFDQRTLARKSGSITISGGDIQTMVDDESYVYAGCHCENYNYQDTYKYPLQDWDWTEIDQIRWIGAWDAATGDYAPEFAPPFLRSNNAGAWASYIDNNETLWVGGDFTGARVNLTTNQWVGGFVRFPMRDHTAPAMNPELRVADVTPETVSLNWKPAADDAGVTGYEVLRDDRVIATTTSLNATVVRGGGDRFFVRAVDEAGNRSASTPVLVVDSDSAGPALNSTIWAGEEWDYWYSADAPDSQWANGQEEQGWESARTPIGFGTSIPLKSVLTQTFDQRPAAFYARKSFMWEGTTEGHQLDVSTWADDGIVVYVNGHEIGRERMGEGAVGHNTFAHAAISSAAAVNDPVVMTIPEQYLVAGENVIAVSVHVNYRSSPNASFDLTLNEAPKPAPAASIELGQEWDYWYSADAPVGEWANGTGTEGWNSAITPVGFGTSIPLKSVLTQTFDQRPAAFYARKSFMWEGTTEGHQLDVSTWADDGIVVYVNGHEIGRHRMAEGSAGHNTFAHAAISSAAALEDPVVMTIPEEYLVPGENVIAVSVHVNYRNSPNMSFDLSLGEVSVAKPVQGVKAL